MISDRANFLLSGRKIYLTYGLCHIFFRKLPDVVKKIFIQLSLISTIYTIAHRNKPPIPKTSYLKFQEFNN